ncbi:MAG TPA: type II toxin-antitoxin system VapC family toxin [Thermoanaerobaculia bacterium]|nr:type II toxin-antitoxin system VapC family toxin [Thermoanaerobaculia bacterium]
MVIDTSALLAILFDEPERRAFNEAIDAAESRVMSAATFVELSIVIESRVGAEGLRDLDLFIERAGIELAAVDVEQAHAARRAFSRFGKGRHRAGLNYGDCFSYALATVLGEPLLYKGDDFPHTDVTPFVPPSH